MTLRRKILLGTVLALVPVAALLRWNHRGRALCDGVARATSAFAWEFRSSGQVGSAWRDATSMFGKRQDILGARWIERGKWRIRLTESLDEPWCGAVKVWHGGKCMMDTCGHSYAVEFPDLPAEDTTADSPGAFVISHSNESYPSAYHGSTVWIFSPTQVVHLKKCDDFWWASNPSSEYFLLEACQYIPVAEEFFCWVIYRVAPHAGVQLLAEDNRLPEPSDEWVRNQISLTLADPTLQLQYIMTPLLISGQWRAVGTLARRLGRRTDDQTWATLIEETIEEIELELPLFTPLFDAYRAEMGTPWHEPDVSARTPAD